MFILSQLLLLLLLNFENDRKTLLDVVVRLVIAETPAGSYF